MSHRYLLVLARLALFSLLALLASGTVNATVYTICNKGKVGVRYATALRQGGSLSGYSWDVDGWYLIPAGKCDDAYHHSNNATDEPIYVAIAFWDSTGVWGAATFQGEDVDAKLCVKKDAFEDHLKGNINQTCKSGYFPFPAALYLEPQDRGCVDTWNEACRQLLAIPGSTNTPYTYSFDFTIDANSRAIPVDKGSGSAAASSPRNMKPTVSAKARLIYGDEVTLYGTQWSYANGAQLPESLINSKTGQPPLLPKAQYSHTQAPVAGYLQQISQAMKSFQTCTGKDLFTIQIAGSRLDMDDYGIVTDAYSETAKMTDGPHVIGSGDGAAIANLDLDKPSIIEHGSGCISVAFPCKTNGPCVREGDRAEIYWSFYVNTKEQADVILNALRKIAPYYPDGAGDIH